MYSFSRIELSRLQLAALCVPLAVGSLLAQTAAPQKSSPQVSVRSVKVLGSKDAVEIEVDASDRIVPETQVLTGPDRLVIDFPMPCRAINCAANPLIEAKLRTCGSGCFSRSQRLRGSYST